MRQPPLQRSVDLVIRAAVPAFAPSPSPPVGVHTDQFLTRLSFGMFHFGWHRHQLTAEVT
jgi:hypothetical protein